MNQAEGGKAGREAWPCGHGRKEGIDVRDVLPCRHLELGVVTPTTPEEYGRSMYACTAALWKRFDAVWQRW